MFSTSTKLESMPTELHNIIAEYIFLKKKSRSPLFRLGLRLRSCNSIYRKIFSAIIKNEIKLSNRMINGRYKILNEQFLSITFIAGNGIFQNIEHIDLSCAKFESNLMRMLPSTLKTLRFQELSLVSFDEIQCISCLLYTSPSPRDS